MKSKVLSRILKSVTAIALATAMTFSMPISAVAAGIQGVDVSKYQGAINWAAVAQSGMSYAFIKAGSTKSGIDPYFAANVTGAQAAGIRTGVYIYSYATTVEAAAQEAALVLQWIEPYNVNFPVAFDIEDGVQKGLDANTCTAIANTFCSVISAAGYTPIVYTYANFYKSHFTSALLYDKWIAQYSDHNDIAGWAIWQYSSGGAVAGISGRVDMNIASKDFAAYIPQVGLLDLGGGNVFFFNNFRRQFGWVDINGVKYHTDPATGIVTTGWFADETGTYYFLPGAANAVVGLNTIDKGIYYFNEAAQLQVGWVTLGENTFLFNPAENGKLYTGWWNDTDGVRYLDTTDGHMLKGLAIVGDAVYYFNEAGLMQVGIVQVNGATYYFGADGKMQTGLQTIGDGVYYFGDDGTMQTGIIQAKDGVYYAGKDGKLVAGQPIKIGNDQYLFGTDGKLVVNQVVQVGDMLYQTNETGIIVATAPAPTATPAAPAK
ncbi:GH25 family lysozyme [Pseudobutyrivibrio xylanivorans]|uniref:Lysozyme n=1 Tax=Pseudobutyrivibrio xylanivorans TaxID=185007 RepID=A0A5P6VRU4_PSEXY|nr:GH25 family lysozyme [Pseudobutyrivibrio xylanivorans]QFJ54419.1 lysozyme [Pseudobutyrivibrio xylanivorans]